MIGLLLAGGHGRRAGGPKALKVLDGRLLWRVHADALRAAGCAAVVAVLHPSAMPAADVDAGATRSLRCVGADADAAMFASLQRGLGYVDVGAAVLVQPVDAGRVLPETAMALRAAAVDGIWVVRPRCGERTGHPLLLSPAACAALRAFAADDSRLDRWIAALDADVVRDVAVEDRGVLANFNHDGTGAGSAEAGRA